MNREEKAKRFQEVKLLVDTTKEGKFKIEQIKSHKSKADEAILNSIFFILAAGVDSLIILLNSAIISNELIKASINGLFVLCGIVNVGRSAYFVKERYKNERLAYNLEEDVLSQLIKG